MSRQPVAFLSTYDKTLLDEFARQLVERFGYRLVATGGTRRFLEEAGLEVEDLSDTTGFDELLGGRVKSLHPQVFAGILARRDQDDTEALRWLFDLVVVNLYPFEQAFALPGDHPDRPDELTELIDIGGSALIRAAAKNHAYTTVVTSPYHYQAVLIDLVASGGTTRPELRKILAREAFQLSAGYDSAVASWLAGGTSSQPTALAPILPLTLHQLQTMRYGENPHQPAALYGLGTREADFDLLHGKPLSFNNILDMEAAWSLVCEWDDVAASAIIKHTQPCGVATGQTLAQAYERALECDPMSAFGGIVACNRPVDADTAALLHPMFLEVVIAPAFDEAALQTLTRKKNLRLVRRTWPAEGHPAASRDGLMVRQVSPSLVLVQQVDYAAGEAVLQENLKVVTQTKPTPEQLQDLAFAWRVAKHLKSNAIVVAHNGQTVGLCGGQTSRVGALEKAVAQACDRATGAVLASDGFFPAVDNIEVAAQNRIAAIIQPGGSIKDAEVITACDRYNIALVTTGIREFRH